MASSVVAPRSLVSLLTIFVFLTSSSVLCDPQATQKLIEDVCHGLYRPPKDTEFCTRIFNMNLKNPSTDIHGLTEIAIRQSLVTSIDSRDFIVSQLKGTKDPAQARLLVSCEETYAAIVRAFQDASRDFSRSDYNGVLSDVRRVQGGQIATCIKASQQLPFNPLSERNFSMDVLIWMSSGATSRLISKPL